MNLNGTIVNLTDVSTIEPHEDYYSPRPGVDSIILYSVFVTLKNGRKIKVHYDSKEQRQGDICKADRDMDRIERGQHATK